MIIDKEDDKIVEALARDLKGLSVNVDEAEAKEAAKEALNYPIYLARKYDLVYPPLLHNTLITLNFKQRGYCYHWAEDMLSYFASKKFKSFDLFWAVSKKGEYWEHNAMVISAKGRGFEEGIVLDPWRDSSKLYWSRVTDDDGYMWSENKRRTGYYSSK